MATIKASVNLFALLDGDDSGDKRLADFDSEHKQDQASALAKKKQAASKAKPKKKPSPPAPAKSKAPTTNPTPPVAAGLRRSYVAASSTARATEMQTTAAPTAPAPAGSTNYTALLFGKAYPSARERIFKQMQEEFQKRQAKAAENGGGVPTDDGKSADAGYGKGKTHGVKVQKGGGYNYHGAKQQPSVVVKEAPMPAPVEEPAVAPAVLQAPPPPSLYDIDQFPTLK